MKVIITAIILALVICFGSGLAVGYNLPHKYAVLPVYKTPYRAVFIPVERIVPEPYFVIQKVPAYVRQTEYVEVTRKLKPFESWHELQVWLANNYVRDAIPDRCVDTALELCQRAWQDGYQMSTELWGDGSEKGHMINSTVIGNNIYFIEPSSNLSWLGGWQPERD